MPGAIETSRAGRVLVYIGTYTSGASQGIYVGELDLATGRLAVAEWAVSAKNPSFLAVDPRRLCLYAVSEVSDLDGQPSGAVRAFALDPRTGQPTPLNTQSSGGAGPCHLSVDPEGQFVLAANYGGGSVALLPIQEDGSLGAATDVAIHHGSGVHPTRQERPHAHSITPDEAGRYALAADLGLDALLTYEIDRTHGRLVPHGLPQAVGRPGAGPRHLDFGPSGRCAYVINELDSTLTAWRYDPAQGRVQEIQTVSTLPTGFTGSNTGADVHLHPSGRFLYGSNRGHDSLAVFTIDPETGAASLRDVVPAGGKNPRGFAIDPTGAFLVAAHQDTDSLATFAIDPDTGDLTPTGHTARVPRPVCVTMLRLPE